MAAQPPICDFGWKAVDAELPGVDGRTHTIFGHRGEKGLLVVFICNHCPYVKAVIDRLVRDAQDLAALGIGTVAISSNDAATYPQDSFDNMKLFAKEHAFAFPYLYDEDQSVARAYGAVCTPDFFGFDADLGLQYRGRLDASRKQQAPAGHRARPLQRHAAGRRDRQGTGRAGPVHRLFDQVEGRRLMAGTEWPKAVLFDLDGTLVDSAPDIHAALNQTLPELWRAALLAGGGRVDDRRRRAEADRAGL